MYVHRRSRVMMIYRELKLFSIAAIIHRYAPRTTHLCANVIRSDESPLRKRTVSLVWTRLWYFSIAEMKEIKLKSFLYKFIHLNKLHKHILPHLVYVHMLDWTENWRKRESYHIERKSSMPWGDRHFLLYIISSNSTNLLFIHSQNGYICFSLI